AATTAGRTRPGRPRPCRGGPPGHARRRGTGAAPELLWPRSQGRERSSRSGYVASYSQQHTGSGAGLHRQPRHDPAAEQVAAQPPQRPAIQRHAIVAGAGAGDRHDPVTGRLADRPETPAPTKGRRLSIPAWLNSWTTRRTWFSSVRTTAAIWGALIPAAEASRIWARWRRANWVAVRAMRLSWAPSAGDSWRTKTDGWRIVTSLAR